MDSFPEFKRKEMEVGSTNLPKSVTLKVNPPTKAPQFGDVHIKKCRQLCSTCRVRIGQV